MVEEETINAIIQMVETFDMTSFISSIVSIVLAIVSLILSIIFFFFGWKSNKETSELAEEIKSNTTKLDTLFNQMFNTTFEMIRSQNDAMQKKLFDNDTMGRVKDNERNNSELNILSTISALQPNCTRKNLKDRFNDLPESTLHSILHTLIKNRLIEENSLGEISIKRNSNENESQGLQ